MKKSIFIIFVILVLNILIFVNAGVLDRNLKGEGIVAEIKEKVIVENFEKIDISKFPKKNSENKFSDTFNSRGVEVFDAFSFGKVNYSKFSVEESDIISGILIYDEKPVKKFKLASSSFKKERGQRIRNIKALAKDIEIKHEYHIFDGIHIQLKKKDLEKLSKINAKFYPARRLKLALHESVPQIDANILHDLGINGSGIKVAVLDTGIDYNHPALTGEINPSDPSQCYAFINNGEESSDCYDVHGHGTHVLGTIASNDDYYKGVAYGADMMMVRIFASGGTGYDPDLVRAIEYAVDNNADIISMSVVTVVDEGQCYSTPTSIASDNAVDAGVITIGGAGNEYRVDGSEAPACSNKTISVGAVDKLDNRADFSNGGYDLDIMAPGVSIYSTLLGGGFGGPDWSGTSMATPHVSGVAALLLQADNTLTPAQMKNLLILTAVDLGDPGFDIFYGYGRVDADDAYDALMNPFPVYITTNTYQDTYSKKSRFFTKDEIVYIEANVSDLIWRYIPGLAVETKVYFADSLQETVPLNHIGNGIYRGSFNSVGYNNGVYNLTVEANNPNGFLSESSQFHIYPGSGVSAYYMDLGSEDYVIENQHLINVFNQEQAEVPLKYLIQKEDMLFYNFLDSEQGSSRGGIHSTYPLNVINTSFDLGEGLVEASINYDVIAITGTAYNPPLDDSDKTCQDQHGSSCNGCTQNTLTSECPPQGVSCSSEYIIDIKSDKTVYAPSEQINVTIDFRCDPDFYSLDGITISYNDGNGWNVMWSGNCYNFGVGEGPYTYSYTFPVSNNSGTHYVRASIQYAFVLNEDYTCAGYNSLDGDNDDITIIVAEEISVGEDSADLNVKMRNGSDYLIYTLDNFNKNFPNFFFSDVIGTLESFDDDRYHVTGGDGLISDLTANLWRDYSSDYVAVYDNTGGDSVNDNVLSFVRFDETTNIDFNKVGVLNQGNKEGSRIKYQTHDVVSEDEVSYLLAFTKGSWLDIEDDMDDIAIKILPLSFYDFICVNGETKLCPLQDGVCLGSEQTCVDEKWSGCDYLGIPNYEQEEVTCDGLDNDCDGIIDEGCAIEDDDGDGVINVWDDCPDTPLGSFVSNRGCSGGGVCSFDINVPMEVDWNLIGYISPSSKPIEQALQFVTGYESVFMYNATSGQWKSYDPLNPEFSDLQNLFPGYGYWVKMGLSKTWNFNGTDIKE